MAINILEPVHHTDDVDFHISYEDAQLLQRIRDKIGKIDAIRVLRFYNKQCGIRQAKLFIESLDVELPA